MKRTVRIDQCLLEAILVGIFFNVDENETGPSAEPLAFPNGAWCVRMSKCITTNLH